jgi:hypothetical protein
LITISKAVLILLGAGMAAIAREPDSFGKCDLHRDGNANGVGVQLITEGALEAAPAANDLSGDGVGNGAGVPMESSAALGLNCAADSPPAVPDFNAASVPTGPEYTCYPDDESGWPARSRPSIACAGCRIAASALRTRRSPSIYTRRITSIRTRPRSYFGAGELFPAASTMAATIFAWEGLRQVVS